MISPYNWRICDPSGEPITNVTVVSDVTKMDSRTKRLYRTIKIGTPESHLAPPGQYLLEDPSGERLPVDLPSNWTAGRTEVREIEQLTAQKASR